MSSLLWNEKTVKIRIYAFLPKMLFMARTTAHKLAFAFNMTLAEFLDFDELNEYSFEDD